MPQDGHDVYMKSVKGTFPQLLLATATYQAMLNYSKATLYLHFPLNPNSLNAEAIAAGQTQCLSYLRMSSCMDAVRMGPCAGTAGGMNACAAPRPPMPGHTGGTAAGIVPMPGPMRPMWPGPCMPPCGTMPCIICGTIGPNPICPMCPGNCGIMPGICICICMAGGIMGICMGDGIMGVGIMPFMGMGMGMTPPGGGMEPDMLPFAPGADVTGTCT